MNRTAVFYLASFGTSLLGNAVTAIALPLLVLMTTGSPLGAGIVAVAAAVPAALAGLLMGSLVDRINRRTAAILSDVISAVALVVLPIIDLTIGLDLGWFIAIAILNSFGDVPGITAREAMLPAVAREARADPARLIGLRESLAGATLLLGPAVAGVLVAALEPASVLWVTAAAAGCAALLTLGVPRPTGTPRVDGAEGGDGTAGIDGAAPRTSPRAAVLLGVSIIARHPLLRTFVLVMLAMGVVLAAAQGMVLPVHFTLQGEPQNLGFVLSALAAGLLLGAGLFSILGTRIPSLAWFASGAVLVTLGFGIIAGLGPVWAVLGGAAAVGLGAGCINPVIGLAFMEQVRDDHRGRVLGAQNALLTLVPPLGVGVAAVGIELASLQATIIALAILWTLSAAAALLSPALRSLPRAG